MNNKVGRNDLCPCGSGLKYKKCCLLKQDDPAYSDIRNLPRIYKEARKNARFKECIYPQHESCSEKIIGAHSIQNNKILSKIADDGMVYMPCPKPELKFSVLKKYGRKEASVFTGFCGHHDKTVFQPIEDRDFSGTEEQIFLLAYRAFAIEYHKKQEAVRIGQFMISKKPSLINASDLPFDSNAGFSMAVNDLKKEKDVFDLALLSGEKDVLTSIVWTFPGFSNFAASGIEAPMYDFDGKLIQDLLDPKIIAGHIFFSIFPEKNNTYAIFAWLHEYDTLFSEIKKKLDHLTDTEKRNFINNTIPVTTENIVIKPSAWDSLSKCAKIEFSLRFLGVSNLLGVKNSLCDRLKSTKYDLFSL